MVQFQHLENATDDPLFWRNAFSRRFLGVEYSVERRCKRGKRAKWSNCGSRQNIFSNKRLFHELMKGSTYYPSVPLHASMDTLVFTKRPFSYCGYNHVITTLRDSGATRVCQMLVDPLLLDGHKFTVRMLLLYTSELACLCWNGAVLRSPFKYSRGDIDAEITNMSYHTSFNKAELKKTPETAFADIAEYLSIDTVPLAHMTQDIADRFCSQCRHRHMYDIHGIDIIFDKYKKPFILETNLDFGMEIVFEPLMFSDAMCVLTGAANAAKHVIVKYPQD